MNSVFQALQNYGHESHEVDKKEAEKIIKMLHTASMHIKEGEKKEAIDLFREAVRVHPMNASIWKAWADFEVSNGDTYRGKLYYKIADIADRDNLHPEINMSMAKVEYNLSNYDAGYQQCNKVLEKVGVDPNISLEAWLMKAKIELKSSNFNNAKEIWAKYISVNWDNACHFRDVAQYLLSVDEIEFAELMTIRGLSCYALEMIQYPSKSFQFEKLDLTPEEYSITMNLFECMVQCQRKLGQG